MTREDPGAENEESQSCQDWSDARFAGQFAALKGLEPEDAQRHSLARVIESKVIPRLLLVHRGNGIFGPNPATVINPIDGAQVGEFADLVINRDAGFATSYFEDMLADGSSVEQLFRDLLAPTARRLGELWDEDINTFVDVTQGLSHLHQLVRTFSPEFNVEAGKSVSNRRALIIPFPGEAHTFGASLVEQYFRREGWHVWAGPPSSLEEVIALVSSMWFDVVGFSVSRVVEPDKLARDIKLVRHAARNRNMAIMIGGLPFVKQPELAALVGADATAADGQQAVALVKGMIGKPALS